MYYMWISKNLVHQVADQTKIITQYIGKGAVSGFACVFKCEHSGKKYIQNTRNIWKPSWLPKLPD
jgi:hypothetical protein